jgi:hypothetical protein
MHKIDYLPQNNDVRSEPAPKITHAPFARVTTIPEGVWVPLCRVALAHGLCLAKVHSDPEIWVYARATRAAFQAASIHVCTMRLLRFRIHVMKLVLSILQL